MYWDTKLAFPSRSNIEQRLIHSKARLGKYCRLKPDILTVKNVIITVGYACLRFAGEGVKLRFNLFRHQKIVGVQKLDVFPMTFTESAVASGADTPIVLLEIADPSIVVRVAQADLLGVIRRAVVD